MRNLKRALSLALASVMLLGMMVVGSSAAFADADEIVNTEAVEITAGLGLFAGSDGKFNPKGNVTRAQMATVIVKMLYGSEINADQFKGTGKFSDVAAFEGGWAEGYINLCANLGIVGGYGDGTFKPGNELTTAEAVTMIINALKVDAGKGTWPMTVMAKAEEIELFEDMAGVKPGTYAAMTRDQLAVVVWNGLNYSADGVKGYEITGVDMEFTTLADAIAYAQAATPAIALTEISEVKGATLAKEVFEIKADKGFIDANQATGEKSTFIDGAEDYNIETGLDQLNHYVTVYFSEAYETEKKPGNAYAVVEMAEYVTVEKAITKKADYIAAFGAKVDNAAGAITDGVVSYDKDAFTAPAGTYVISTDEDYNEGKIIKFIAPATYTVGEVTAVVETAGKEYIKIDTKRYNNNEDEDVIVAYEGIAEDDIVVYTQVTDSQSNTMTFVSKPEVISGKVTKTKDASGEYANRIWVDGKEYSMSAVDASALMDDYATIKGDLADNNTYDVYLFEGKVLGAIATAGNANISEVIYVTDVYGTTESGSYGSKAMSYFAQGVNAAGEEVSFLIGVAGASESCTDACVDADGKVAYEADGTTPKCAHVVHTLTENAFYTFKKVEASTDKKQAAKGVMAADPVVPEASFNPDNDDYFAAAVDSVNTTDFNKDSKFLNVAGSTAVADRVYLTAETKFFIVDETQGIDALKVTTYTGNIAKAFTGDIDVIAIEDEDEVRYAQLVVINAASGLASEDVLYVSDIAAADFSKVDGGFEFVAFFSETNEFKTIVAVDAPVAGFYAEFEIDEETGIYTLTGHEYTTNVGEGVLTGMVGNGIITSGDLDLDLTNASEAKIYDLRDPEVIEDSEVAEIATLKDLQLILKDKKQVTFDVVVDTKDTVDTADDVVTHIFVKSVKFEKTYCDGTGTGAWVEDDGTVYPDTCKETDTTPADGKCDICGAAIPV